ncbi:hypothetical protein SEUCBS140593_001529 [Sporothrix eucalyptigena]|uniref:Beta-lactamase-related domain-containing protein n=1 Tax=Sporothrix eucalyptigena TaxID=1812306 RepID=A0ABP0AYY5_9PEZI
MEGFETELSKATDPVEGHLLGAVAMVTDNKGNFLYKKSAGRQRLFEDSPPLDDDCTISLYSAGRFFTKVAALQLVERGLVGLDDSINKHIPELEQCRVLEKKEDGTIIDHPRSRDITLRDILLNTSGICGNYAYKELLGVEQDAPGIPSLVFSPDTHVLARNNITHLFYEPGQGYYYGGCIYMVQLLVERLGGERRYVEYAQKHVFEVLGLTSTTYVPAKTPHVWEKRLQAVERDGNSLKPRDDLTYGVTCSVSDLATIFGDLMSEDSKLLKDPALRDLLFTPQLAAGSPAHEMFLKDVTNYAFVLPLAEGEDCDKTWLQALPPAKINWTVAGAIYETDDGLPGSGMPAGTVTFEGLPNIIWTMNREKGRMMLFGNQLFSSYDVRAHNLAVQFLRDSWRTFG